MRAAKQGLLCALAGISSAAAMAGTIHHVRFAQPAQILVWESGALIARGDRIELFPNAAGLQHDIPGAGTLLPLAAESRRTRVISVASNTAFSLIGSDEQTAGTVAVQILGVGENAQSQPLQSSGSLFRQGVKTAVRKGSPQSQSIELKISWSSDVPPTLVLAAD